MNNNDFGSIGWQPPANLPQAPELIGWGMELVGWGNEIVGSQVELIGCPAVGYANPEIIGGQIEMAYDGSFGGGTDADWEQTDTFGFFPLIIGAVAGIASAVAGAASAAAAVVGPIVAAVGGVQGVVSMVGGGIAAAEQLIKAAKGGDEKAIAKLKSIKKKKQQQTANTREAGEKKLAELMVRARQGDLKAQAVLAGVQILKDQAVQKAAGAGKFMGVFRMPPTRAMLDKVMNEQAGDHWAKFEKRAYEIAKKSGKLPKAPPKVVLPLKAMKAAAAKAAVKTLKKGNEKLKAQKAGAQGFLVTPGGRVRPGRWVPAQVVRK